MNRYKHSVTHTLSHLSPDSEGGCDSFAPAIVHFLARNQGLIRKPLSVKVSNMVGSMSERECALHFADLDGTVDAEVDVDQA